MAITGTRQFNAEPERNVASFEGKTTNLDVMRRKQLWDLARAMGIPFKEGETKDKMIELIKGHQHVIDALNDAAELMEFSGDKQTPLVDQVAKVLHKAAIKEGVFADEIVGVAAGKTVVTEDEEVGRCDYDKFRQTRTYWGQTVGVGSSSKVTIMVIYTI